MNITNQYKVPFRNLKEGVHDFILDINDAFFAYFENSEVQKGLLKAEIQLVKKTEIAILNIQINGQAEVICDRCLDPFNQPITFEGSLYIKTTYSESDEGNDELILLAPEENEVDLSHYLYESICLSIPYQRVHPVVKGKSTCNAEMLKRLKGYQAGDEELDPRWEALKKLKDKGL